jgi:hypothetical protein
MTGDVELYERFVSYLKAFAVGAEHAQTAVTICAALGLEPDEVNRRHLRGCAQEASQRGVLVCSGQRGYYVPASPAEVLASTKRLKSEAGELWRRAKRVEQLAAAHFDLREAPEPESERPALLALMDAS